jgi:hypothetical protein
VSYYLTSDDLIASVKRRAMIPTTQNTFQNSDFLAFADEEMNLGMVPSITSAHEDYFLYTIEIPMATNQILYEIPYRAIGNKIREVSLRDPNGNIFEMTRIGVGDLPFYNGPATYTRVYAYYLEGNNIHLVPEQITMQPNTLLRISFYMRPNSLVMLDAVGVISSIDRTTGMVQLSNIPSTFNQNQLYDFIKVQSPHKTYNFDISPISVNSTSKTITFNVSDIPDQLTVGDHITLAEQSAIPQIPSDLHVVLAHRVAARCLEALGDSEGLQNANAKLADMEKKQMDLIYNRVEDATQKVVNRHGLLRRGLYSRRYRYRG